MNADSFFCIGSTHRICQDYVVHGKDYVILSDGCSSAPDTDFGSRILCKSMQSVIKEKSNLHIEDLLACTLYKAEAVVNELFELNNDCLCATLVFARIENNFFKVYTTGDAVIAAKKKDGTLEIIQYEFPSGAPYYLRYELNELLNDYVSKFGIQVNKIKYSCKIDCNDNIFYPISEDIELNLASLGFPFFVNSFDCEDYDFVAIMSDGATSFQQNVVTETSKTNSSIQMPFVIKQILDFKGLFGEFVQRRTQKVLKELKKNHIHHYDDFSIGVISI